MQFPEAGLEIYKVPSSERSLSSRKAALRASPEVRFAGSVLTDPKTGEPVIYTENIFIKFIDSLDQKKCLEIIRLANLTIKQTLEYATNAYFAAAAEGSGTQVFKTALDLLNREEVEHAHPEILRQRQKRAIHPNQWHLKKTTVTYQAEIDASANVEAAHHLSQGEGVVIAIIDDGFDIDHPEFSGAGKIIAPKDVSIPEVSDDPRPKQSTDSHGTAVAGVACANGQHGASGVAPKAKLMPIRHGNIALGSIEEGNAFYWALANGADIISCSWGPPDGDATDPNDPMHNSIFPLPASTRLAIDCAVNQGRGGKGCVIFFAAGNGNESADNDGYASHEKVIAVAACNDNNRRSFYSDYGKAVWCAFPSNDKPKFSFIRGIWTTDRSGSAGYNKGSIHAGDLFGNYTNSFGGTSSSCPGAAGVAALILAANPVLRWDEVRDILAQSCDKITHKLDGPRGQYDQNGHSYFYGYGRVNAEKAVKLALERGFINP
jgi:subtilisin family serine protease